MLKAKCAGQNWYAIVNKAGKLHCMTDDKNQASLITQCVLESLQSEQKAKRESFRRIRFIGVTQ